MILIAQIALGAIIGLALAAEPAGRLTLACEGTTTTKNIEMQVDEKPEPISMGITVDFAARTVDGFGVLVPITDLGDVTVVFYSNDPGDADAHMNTTIFGTIDRMTGEVRAAKIWVGLANNKSPVDIWTNFSLKCKPTQRMF